LKTACCLSFYDYPNIFGEDHTLHLQEAARYEELVRGQVAGVEEEDWQEVEQGQHHDKVHTATAYQVLPQGHATLG
jgi:hypothetical protein